MSNWKNNVSFVLVEPHEPANIGASARAMKNMGFKNLCLVRAAEMNDEARRLAHNAVDVLESAGHYSRLDEAIEDRALVVAVARRTGKRRGMVFQPDQAAQKIYEIAARNKVALLFGREDRGLYNEEVNECGMLLTIPAHKEHPSLNLSHAVIVVAYALSRAQYNNGPIQAGVVEDRRSLGHASVIRTSGRARSGIVDHGELAALYDRLAHIITLLDYVPRGDRNVNKQIIDNLKHFIGRAGLTFWELKMLHGLCSQIELKLRGPE